MSLDESTSASSEPSKSDWKRLIKRQIPFVIAIFFAVGSFLGWHLRSQEMNDGLGASAPIIRVLVPKGFFEPELIKRFESREKIRIHLSEADNGEDLWRRLAGTAAGVSDYDFVLLFASQIPLAFQASYLVPIDWSRLANRDSVTRDFVDIPASRHFTEVVPLVWAVSGIGYDSKRWAQPPESWLKIIAEMGIKDAIPAPASRAEIARLSSFVFGDQSIKPGKKNGDKIEASFQLGSSPLHTFTNGRNINAATTAMIHHSELAFSPLKKTDWRFLLPAEKGSLTFVAFAIRRRATNINEGYRFLDFLLEAKSAVSLLRSTHMASCLKDLNSFKRLDERLKAKYFREMPLDQITLWIDTDLPLRAADSQQEAQPASDMSKAKPRRTPVEITK